MKHAFSHPATVRLTTLLGVTLVLAVVSHAAELYGVTGSGGTPSATLHLISQTDASVVPLVTVGDNGGGQAIAFNPDDGYMYHWAGFPSGNAIFERVDLDTLSVTNIPLSGFASNEIFAATFDSAIGGFLTTDLSFNFIAVTADGFRVELGDTSTWMKGLAFVGDTLYAARNSTNGPDGDAELHTIDPATGSTLTTTVVTMPGYRIFGFNGLATHPETGELWAVVRRDGLSGRTRMLATVDPVSGVLTQVGILPEGSGFAGIAFAPDPVIPVQIDVKPDDDTNAINPGSKGVIPVAIFSTDDFDATSIDPTTIELAGAGVAVVGKGKSLYHEVDVNDDGLTDLLCQVETESLTLEPDAGEVWLVGETYDGQLVQGHDFIMVVPNFE